MIIIFDIVQHKVSFGALYVRLMTVEQYEIIIIIIVERRAMKKIVVETECLKPALGQSTDHDQ